MILGLEFLIAGDIIRTVIVADTLTNVMILGLIIPKKLGVKKLGVKET
ncbi:MAG: DUF1622 domain-containing protein, partial [Gammaproteobacteria bacterium]|nr:DUF1622 domain-containing protein [Gammaproteobacteria bacterium]